MRHYRGQQGRQKQEKNPHRGGENRWSLVPVAAMPALPALAELPGWPEAAPLLPVCTGLGLTPAKILSL